MSKNPYLNKICENRYYSALRIHVSLRSLALFLKKLDLFGQIK